ncbi:hypothetical protein [Photobacterium leiognathi]|nr:hypothetical protein [Photobacterium leiognathi]
MITNEQIRRSGVRSIAEAVALAPGVRGKPSESSVN